MKRLFLLSMIFGFSHVALAVDDTGEHASLFEDTYLDSGYSGIGVRTSSFAGQGAVLATAVGGWRFDQKLTFGLRGDSLLGSLPVGVVGASSLGFYTVSGFGEWNLVDRGLLGLHAGAAMGWGEAGYRLRTGDATSWQSTPLTTFEPEITGLFHISHRLDLALSAGYRLVRGVDLDGLGNGTFKGNTTSLVLRGNF